MTRLGLVGITAVLCSSVACGRGTAREAGPADPVGIPDAGMEGPDAGRDGGGPSPGDDAEAAGGDAGAPNDAGKAGPDASQDEPDAGSPEAGSPAPYEGDWVPPSMPTLAARPPMGWRSGHREGCGVDEALVHDMAEAMATNGMREAGYEYVVVDDCWQTVRNPDNTIAADPNTFPSGIAALSDYLHGRQLKLGIGSDRGTETCGGRPGSQGHEARDAQTYAMWGVDYLAYTSCSAGLDAETQYRTMQMALASSGRPMVFSVAAGVFAEYMPALGQLWRTTGNIQDNWSDLLGVLDRNAFYAAYARPGAWNDPDALEVGNGGLSEAEYRAQFSLWAMMAAPLMASSDLTTLAPEMRAILTNREVIAVDQDPWGYQGYRVQSDDGLEVWTRPLEGTGQRALLFFNRTSAVAGMSVSLGDLGLAPGRANLRDLWRHADVGAATDTIMANVPPHDVVMLKVSGSEPEPPTSDVYLSDLPFTYAANGWGVVERDRSVGDWYDEDGQILRIGGQAYTKGLGVHGGSLVRIRLGRRCTRLRAHVGIDDETGGKGSVVFKVYLDGELGFASELVRSGAASVVDLDVTGAGELKLEVTNGGDGADNDHADWADARLECDP